jgi:3-hydroxyacyl-CoA dehydrogenase
VGKIVEHRINKVSVIGLGYIGLTTAAVIAGSGIDVVGVDVDAAVELDQLAHLGDQALDLRNDGTGRGDELVLVDRDVGVERRDQELAHALGTAGEKQ